ncbi:MAG: hemerythrin domain-containing protein [Magnetococcus sp. DMHC-1]|nr:hemerythrin domain-containing protein [Magnetococcales bacterium]
MAREQNLTVKSSVPGNTPTPDLGSSLAQDMVIDNFRGNLMARLREVKPEQMHQQHMGLVEITADLYNRVKIFQRGKPTPNNIQDLNASLAKLFLYTNRHFQEEEALMLRIKYPYLKEHQQAHKDFVVRLESIKKQIDTDGVSYIMDLFFLVVGWLFDHINTLDMQYSRFQQGVQPASLPGLQARSMPSPTKSSSTIPSPSSATTPSDSFNPAQFRSKLKNQLQDVGVAQFNRDHQKLMDHILEFHELIDGLNRRRPTSRDWESINRLLGFMGEYGQSHFQGEETLMLRHKYPEYEAHRREHNDLLTKFSLIRNKLIREKNILFAVDLKFFLLEWLLNHSSRTDMQYRDFFRGKGVT